MGCSSSIFHLLPILFVSGAAVGEVGRHGSPPTPPWIDYYDYFNGVPTYYGYQSHRGWPLAAPQQQQQQQQQPLLPYTITQPPQYGSGGYYYYSPGMFAGSSGTTTTLSQTPTLWTLLPPLSTPVAAAPKQRSVGERRRRPAAKVPDGAAFRMAAAEYDRRRNAARSSGLNDEEEDADEWRITAAAGASASESSASSPTASLVEKILTRLPAIFSETMSKMGTRPPESGMPDVSAGNGKRSPSASSPSTATYYSGSGNEWIVDEMVTPSTSRRHAKSKENADAFLSVDAENVDHRKPDVNLDGTPKIPSIFGDLLSAMGWKEGGKNGATISSSFPFSSFASSSKSRRNVGDLSEEQEASSLTSSSEVIRPQPSGHPSWSLLESFLNNNNKKKRGSVSVVENASGGVPRSGDDRDESDENNLLGKLISGSKRLDEIDWMSTFLGKTGVGGGASDSGDALAQLLGGGGGNDGGASPNWGALLLGSGLDDDASIPNASVANGRRRLLFVRTDAADGSEKR